MEEGKEDAGAVVGFAFRAWRGEEEEMKEEKKQPLRLPPTPPPQKNIFSSPREEITLPQKREGASQSTRKAERNLQRERHWCVAAAASSLRPA